MFFFNGHVKPRSAAECLITYLTLWPEDANVWFFLWRFTTWSWLGSLLWWPSSTDVPHIQTACVFFASECLKFPSRTSRQVLGFFKTCHPVSLQLFLFLKLAVGLHHALPLLLHHPLSGHGRLVCGADGVPEKRVEQQRLGFLLEDRRREMRRPSKEFFTSTSWWQQQGSLPAI